MKALHQTQSENHESEAHVTIFRILINRISQASESIWLCITFLLFLAMGPFSVIAVLYGLWTLATNQNMETIVEPVNC